MSPADGDALARVVDYFSDDESDDFLAEGFPINHIVVDSAFLIVGENRGGRERLADADAPAKNR